MPSSSHLRRFLVHEDVPHAQPGPAGRPAAVNKIMAGIIIVSPGKRSPPAVRLMM
jgi:hypothetical protein